jgi:predicted membrane channel-forming protein YqfA (hemolysin III family)
MTDQTGRETRSEDRGSPEETEKQRVDRELIELLNELRVTLPGVQVLFAFLLTVPFSVGFSRLSSGQRGWYFASFIATASATVLLVAPASYHRIRFRTGGKDRMLRTANHLAIAGMVLLAVAMASAVFLVTDVLFSTWSASVVSAGLGAAITWIWFGLPLVRRARTA